MADEWEEKKKKERKKILISVSLAADFGRDSLPLTNRIYLRATA